MNDLVKLLPDTHGRGHETSAAALKQVREQEAPQTSNILSSGHSISGVESKTQHKIIHTHASSLAV